MAEVAFELDNYVAPQKITLSPQQAHVMDWVDSSDGNGLIIAVAGSGKTTTLIEAVSRMRGRIAFAAYNRRIANEIRDKVAARGISSARVNTFHGFGYAAYRSAHPNCTLDGDKIHNLVREYKVVRDGKTDKIPQMLWEFVEKLVSLVRQSGVGIVTRINDGAAWDAVIEHHALDELFQNRKPWEREKSELDQGAIDDLVSIGKMWALRILQQSIREAIAEPALIDFDDQLFMPLYENLPIQQYDWVLVDEAQDSNVMRRELARRMLADGGRLLAVGDPAQAIYGFTGADSDSLDIIRDSFGCAEMPLTVSYRCPRAIVEVARQWVSHIEPAPDAPEGTVANMNMDALLQELVTMPRPMATQSVVLCRVNAPTIQIAFALIRAHIPCHVEGRDIGKQIKTLATKWKVNTLNELVARVDAFKSREVAKFMRSGKSTRAEQVEDRCDTLIYLIQGLYDQTGEDVEPSINDLNRLIDSMFQDDVKTGVTLSSIHKSKGREWTNVYWLGKNKYQPSKFASMEWQKEQEVNLMYVAATRAMSRLVFVEVPNDRDLS